MPKFIDQFQDSAADTNSAWTPDSAVETERERLERICAVLTHALDVPRRLGADASPPELAADKTMLKRALSRYKMYHRQWTGTDEAVAARAESDAATHRDGAQFNAKQHWADQQSYLRAKLVEYSTQAKRNGYTKQGNSFANRIVNELNTLGDVFYDPDAD